ncbi:MAG: ribosome small subunit-dependent GTPase A [Actinobacteria bacterium]|nr:ribosome small subunit-dependent GTPase A [Actinomycetota bacterium]
MSNEMTNDAHEGLANATTRDDAAHALALGWNERLATELIEKKYYITSLQHSRRLGRVSRIDRGWSTILTSGVHDAIDGVERVRNIGAEVAVGDWVIISDDLEKIDHVLSRSSALTRRASSDTVRAESHTVAANIDTVLVVQAATQDPNLRRIERELVLAFDSGAQPVLVFNKIDEMDADGLSLMVRRVEPVLAGVPLLFASAKTGAGLDGLRAYTYIYDSAKSVASAPQTIALLGASGVGKSTLINALSGHDGQATGAVREGDQRGRHTTTAAELVRLVNGGWLIDTPGLRAVSLWMSNHGIELAFSDIFTLTESCKFRDCKHEDEPSCAVQAAVERGDVSLERLANMKMLVAEELELEEQKAVHDRAYDRKGARKKPKN